MNEFALQHIPESKYCFAVNENTVSLRLRVSAEDFPESVDVIYGGKYDYATQRKSAPMKRSFQDRLFAYYTVDLVLEDIRLVYIFEISENGKTYYFSEDGLTEEYDYKLSFYNCFQLAYINDVDILKPVEWMKMATFYQIFVERFCVGNKDKDTSYINLKWGQKPTPKSFAGGDLEGIIQKLDYIKELGINAVYLTPIFESPSYHKYDISDYYTIDKHFGDNETFRRLVDGAHKRCIKIVLDAVFNHCSENSAQFQDVLKNGSASDYFNWFIVYGDKIDCKKINYECFAACSYMPKFNTSNPEVQSYLIDIATYWIKEYDIDGWRLDVSDEVSHDFWRRFRKAVKAVKSDCVLIGENWHDANQYLQGDQYDSIMNYAFTKACLDFYCFGRFTPKQFAEKLNEILMRNTDAVNVMMLNLLDSHDTYRFVTQAKSEAKLKSALAVLYLFVGAPCIYYGTEIALQGNFDPDSRRTFDWKKVEEDTDLKRLIKTLTGLKRSGLLGGTDIHIYEHDGLVVLERNALKLVVNESGAKRNYSVAEVICSDGYNGGELLNHGYVLEKK